MRKILFIAVSALLAASTGYSQNTDRTHPPKAGPAPIIKLADPVVYTLANGITVLVVENHKIPSVSASYYIYTGPVKEGEKAGVMGLMGGMLNQGTQKLSKAQFDEAAEQDGTKIGLNSNGGNVSALDRYFDKGLMLLAQALQQPAFNPADFDKLKSQAITGIKADEKSVDAISENVTGALLFGKNSPLGEFKTAASIQNISLEDVKSMYQQYITPSNGYLTFVGDIKPEEAKKLAEKYFGNWKGAKISLPQIADVSNPAKTEIDVIDVPNAVQSKIDVTNVVSLPLDSKDYFPALIANQILGGGSDAYLFKDLREKHAFTYGAYSSISGGVYQTSFSAGASVRNAVTDSAVTRFLANIQRIRTEAVAEDLLNNVKAAYNGNFAIGTENPARIASFARNIMIYHLPKDYYRTLLQKINAVSTADVMRVAKKYFNYDNTRIVVTGKAEEVLPGLEKLGFPVKLYDKDANPVTAATTNSATNVNAADVIQQYIKAIGGEDNIRKIHSMSITGNMQIQTMSIPFTMKRMLPNKEVITMSMNGNVVSKTVFDGQKGYQMQSGQTKPMAASAINRYMDQKGIIPQLFYNDGTFKLVSKGIVKVNGKDAYKIEVTGPSGEMHSEYYDTKTGYLVQTDMMNEMNGQQVSIMNNFDNYKSINNVLLPYSQTLTIAATEGSQEMGMEMDEIKINEGVTDEDFK